VTVDVLQREPPGRLNVALALVSYATAAGLLWLASRGGITLVLAAIAFSFAANTIFSLLHESVHGIFHRDRRVNELFGCVSAAFFPTGLAFQRACHFGHHRRNRTDAELFDYFTPGQSRWAKAYQLYSLLTGLYWLSIPIGCLLYLPLRRAITSRRVQSALAQTGVTPMLADLAEAPAARARLEIAFSISFQALLFVGLNLTLAGWAACYGAFALNWCALQYTDHAFTPRDVRNGASNLRVNRVVQYLFLNYHHHLAHHQHPRVPWLYLPELVDFGAPRRSFLKTYLRLWLGPRLTTEPSPRRLDPELERMLELPGA
jgi:fatty acid desaturase